MPATRVQLALNVEDLSAATAFYSKLFGVEPHKQRDGYANFVIADPPLKLVLIENPSSDRAPQPPRGRGLDSWRRVRGTPAVPGRGAGHHGRRTGVCCHAVQDKVFVAAPDVPNGGGSSTS